MVAPCRTWQHLFPLAAAAPGPLPAIAEILGRAEVEAELARAEREERFPEEIVATLRAAGLDEIFVGWDDRPRATIASIVTLNAIAAQASGSLAISLGITGLALLPAYLAGDAGQLAELRARVEGGAVCAMLLSELEAGSQLVAIRTRADATEGRTGYVLTGEKQLINLVRRADLLMTLARTAEPSATTGLGATGGLSVLLVDRDDTVESLPRWRTSPAPAADIGGVRFAGTRVPAGRRIGEEGEGFSLVQKSLGISRGGIAGFAAGTSNRALGLALAHARGRVLYGAPIVRLDAIADHLARMAAWDLATTCLALRGCAALNALGLRAAHQTAIAKLTACDLAERAVAEGRAVLAARSLLVDLPYQQVVRDVQLYGIFDGTRHLMLDQIQRRLRQIAGGPAGAATAPASPSADEAADALYRAAPVSVLELGRRRGRPWLPRPSQAAARLADLPGALDLGPLVEVAAALEDVARRLPTEAWETQSTSFALAECLGMLEAAIAVVELADPARRAAVGARPADPGACAEVGAPLELVAGLAVALVAGRAYAEVRRIAHAAGLEPAGGAAERELARTEARTGTAVRQALRDARR